MNDYIGEHRAETPTQVDFPGRAVLRTIVQVGIPAVLLLGVLTPQIVEIILEESGETMPASVQVWLLSISGAITALSAILTRVMAIPQVNDALGKLHLSAKP